MILEHMPNTIQMQVLYKQDSIILDSCNKYKK